MLGLIVLFLSVSIIGSDSGMEYSRNNQINNRRPQHAPPPPQLVFSKATREKL